MLHETPPFEWKEAAISEKWGTGIVFYFRFIKFLILYDFILFVLSWVTFIPHFINYFQDGNNFSRSDQSSLNVNETSTSDLYSQFLNSITLSSYTPNDFPAWYVFSGLSVLAVILMTYIYEHCVVKRYPIEDRYFGQYGIQHHHQPAVDNLVSIQAFHLEHTVENLSQTHTLNELRYGTFDKLWRNGLSFILFCGFIVSFSVIVYYVQAASQKFSENTTFTSLILAVLHGTVKAGCAFLCQLLSLVELHEYNRVLLVWETARLFTFQLFCYFAFYFIRDIGLKDQQNSNPGSDACSSNSLGVQHLLLSLSYIYSDLFDAIFITWIINKFQHWRNIRKVSRNEHLLCDFNLAEQYTRVLFRQALLCGGITFILGSPLLACLGHWIQLRADRYRLLHLTYTKYRTQSAYVNMLHCYGLVFTLILLFAYPKGYIFLWWQSDTYFKCDSFKSTLT